MCITQSIFGIVSIQFARFIIEIEPELLVMCKAYRITIMPLAAFVMFFFYFYLLDQAMGRMCGCTWVQIIKHNVFSAIFVRNLVEVWLNYFTLKCRFFVIKVLKQIVVKEKVNLYSMPSLLVNMLFLIPFTECGMTYSCYYYFVHFVLLVIQQCVAIV